MLEISPVDFPNVCRLCLKNGNSTKLLECSKYLSLIHKITKLQVHQNDNLPKNICNRCLTQLDEICNFIETCNRNDDLLTDFIVIKKEIDESFVTLNPGYDENSDSSENYAGPTHSDESDVEKNKQVSCKYCSQQFKSVYKRNLHMNNTCPVKNKHSNAKTGDYKCAICHWIGTSKPSLRIHEKKEHTENIEVSAGLKKKKWKCSECEKLFSKKIDLQRHGRIHSGIRPFSCKLCDRSFTQKSTLERHITSKHYEKEEEKYNFECYICERKFVRKDHLEAHMHNVHIKRQSNEPLELDSFLDTRACRLCGKSFSVYSYLQNHLSVHEETKPAKPPPKIRNCRFSTSSNLCSICGKSFEKRKTFQMHMNRKHSDKKYTPKPKPKLDTKKDNYQCWHCGKIFTTLSNLKVHIRIHTGEKPYECKFCSQRFAAYSSWHEHENIHTGAKPFQCDFCKKGFRQRGSLRKHLRSSVHRKLAESQ